ncbi:MAG: Grx4 family monothiol glutaredoxin [Myxococcales bacterium]|nr:Grx4 family monothiol glutaredoxin [Myxococcales bacterium]MCB9703161.1 Grx4 family monothiol glutaredoxin [Myxococcales bacterium]
MSVDEVREKITAMIASDRVVLFMKGTRFQPQCGFSATVVGILDGLVPSYTTVNVLADPLIREGIKEFSAWPTIPQLYVDGNFVGGCDIVREMEASGELHGVLGADQAPVKAPAVKVSERALATLREVAQETGESTIRVRISPRYHHDLAFEEEEPGDLAVDLEGIRLVFDRMSAVRAEGMSIDFVEQGPSSGFKIDNPNAPPSVKQISARQLRERLDAGAGELLLIDVRTPQEREIATIAGARPFDDETQALLETLDRKTPLIFHCHHGMRSQRAAEYFLSQGFVDVSNLQGGIDAWSVEVDPAVPRY